MPPSFNRHFSLVFFVLAGWIIACRTANISGKQRSEIFPLYKITKIDSVNSYYFIYARRDNKNFKIISEKSAYGSGRKLRIHKTYHLDLISYQTGKSISNLEPLPVNTTLIGCFGFDDSTSICYEKKCVRDLYRLENLEGLYLKQE